MTNREKYAKEIEHIDETMDIETYSKLNEELRELYMPKCSTCALRNYAKLYGGDEYDK